ncbi:non-heme iron oxygenase ferredoxin subunit [Rhodococcus erythropolis]|uniref:non-heme iron oxygenase ferredoxin subunit n=1 Tax=Rhodococcus erythropolis TaxID=1833 RepID=UPI001BE56D70|nr:non-heme iron oxygenase ferredoxin subunit [Rhodococcus erythropolis]MBT2268974.1 non-heme iron oxygenase ferredoxin subunit [Rhodococcus erythropolis]
MNERDHEAQWTRVAPASDIEPGSAITVPGVTPAVAVFNVDGEFLSTADTCTHAESALSEGFIEGATVECEFHFAKFCLRTGTALTAPATVAIDVYPVKVENGDVYVDVSGPRH